MTDDTPHLISLRKVCEMTSLSRTSINRMREANEFPQPVGLGNRVTFVRSEVVAWIEERIGRRAVAKAKREDKNKAKAERKAREAA